ncbi:15006_t:CDS:2 [Funneliformis mosseae]|uniref:15006_t:CDS:1 n=1 Tax=Funneliformis mosseae TaxID=27381 RepID=A0A9N8VHJ4_FUNMO|nr:15006_t:CDS:2 [Funneliformis mosseae]
MSIDGTPIILWCFVQGSSSIFKVNIGTNNDIDDLKEAIKNDDNELKDERSTIVNTFFGIEGRNIRVVIKIPVNVAFPNLYRTSKNVKKIRKYPSPSSFAQISNLNEYQIKDQAFLIYRPSECVSIPLKLYNSAFCNFQKNFENKQLLVDKSYYQWTLNCIKTMADIYSNEKLRQREFHEKIRELFREESILYLLIEVKNEIGTGKCDPTNQAAISFAKFYTQSKNEQMLKWCNMPCFIIGLAGPWICVLGAVYVEKPLVEPLTNLIPLIPVNDRDHLKKIARLFMALRLEDFELEYKEKLVDDSYKLLWKAETKDKQMIIVKFTHRYNKEAHDLCYGIGKAPRLFYVSDKQCGLHMIVMEFVEGQILRDCVHLAQSDYEVIINDIEEAVLHLHGKNLVFADLRDSNILVTRDSEGYHGILIDFDWVGRENVECYPLFINLDIAWPTGVEIMNH